jgi:hypothetical protein
MPLQTEFFNDKINCAFQKSYTMLYDPFKQAAKHILIMMQDSEFLF